VGKYAGSLLIIAGELPLVVSVSVWLVSWILDSLSGWLVVWTGWLGGMRLVGWLVGWFVFTGSTFVGQVG
jgi:hypothetical protein